MPRRSDRTSEGSGVVSGSANSSGILPTTAASRARGKARSGTAGNDAAAVGAAAGEKRFEDLMMDQTADVAELTFITEARRPAARAAPSSSASTAKRKRAVANEPAEAQQAPSSSRAAPRKARKTLGEEIGDEGFIFTREGRRPPTPPQTDEEVGGATVSRKTSSGSSSAKRGIPGSMGPPPAASKSRSNARGPASGTIYSDLPEGGETPIIRRNQAFRAGLPTASDRAASGSSAAGPSSSGGGKRARRDSLNLKATRRVSILTSGAAAHPHLDVPDWELFRHCSGTLPAEERMAHIASWLLKRGMMAALKGDDVTAAPVAARAQDDKRKKKGKAAAASDPAASLQPLSDDEKRHLVRAQQSLEAAMEQTLRDLSDGKVDVAWGKAGKSSGKGLAPHPRNVANASSAVRLEGLLATMRSECSAWEAERDEVEAYRQRTQELLDEVAEANSRDAARSKSASSPKLADITAPSLGAALDAIEAQWTEEDLSPAALSQLADARESLAAIAHWIKGAGGGAAAERSVLAAAQAQSSVTPSEAGPSKGKSRGRKSVAMTNEGLGEGGLEGTALDPRWLEAELQTDILRSRAHPFTQLSDLSRRYISLVSGRGAETLRRMAGIRGEADLGLVGGGADEEEGAASAAFGSSAVGGGEGGNHVGEGAAASNRESRRHVEGLVRGIRRAEAVSATPTKGKGKGKGKDQMGAGEDDGGDGDEAHDDSGLGHDEPSGVGSSSVADDSNMDLLRALASASSAH